MNWPELSFWVSVAQWAATLSVGAYVFNVTRHRATQEEIRKVEKGAHERIDEHATRLAKAEEHIKHLPGAADFAAVSGDLKAMRAQLEAHGTLLSHLNTSIDRVNNYLLNSKAAP